MEHIVTVRSVSRRYGREPNELTALDSVSMSVGTGELVALMGPSGSGKSTLLKIIGSLDDPTAGNVSCDGIDITRLDAAQRATLRRRDIGFVFQDYNLLAGLTALENVAAPLELDGRSTRESRRLALAGLERVGLGDRGSAFPHQLSGGQRQRVAIARGLIGDRKVLLADEPTGALDRASGRAVLSLVRQACDAGTAAIVATHDHEVAEWADRIVHLCDGRRTELVGP